MSAEPLSRDGAWFVGLDTEGSLDRKWPYGGEGREGVSIVMGDSAKIVKVIPITTARILLHAAEERAERMSGALEGAEDFLERVTRWVGGDPDECHEVLVTIREALAADDAARGES